MKMTLPQARTALRHWLGPNEIYYRSGRSPTWDALHRNGWLEPTGETGNFPNGWDYVVMRVTKDAALKASCMLVNELSK